MTTPEWNDASYVRPRVVQPAPKVGPTISPEPDSDGFATAPPYISTYDQWQEAARAATKDPEQEDTRRLATLITQVLSGGQLDGTAIPTECLFLAQMIKGQGWRQCQCKDGCCR